MRRLGDVARERRSLDAVARQFVRHRFGFLGALRIDDSDVRALCRERMTDALSKSAVTAGDDRDAVLQVHDFPLGLTLVARMGYDDVRGTLPSIG